MANQLNEPVEWIEESIRQHGDRLFRTAIAIVGNKVDAEDIVQETFIKLFEKRPEFQSVEHEKAWLIRVTVNLCKSHLRSHWWKKTEALLDSYPAEIKEEHELIEAIQKMPIRYRIVIHLFYYEGYSTKEIAEITKQKYGTVRQQLTRGRRMLKDLLKGERL